ncbi:ArgS-related anticodon-binding protein NrtL [Streptomyces sp. NPDC086080]|uniref:ArgS-related anticodon-binding protein NrtL n=1 Tax=Streptomyces sp. NPDC086080 TaxID=3365748 RepID=UPI0037D04217
MTPVELSRTVLHAVRRAVEEGELAVAVPERVVVAPPGPGGCGDYATNVALQIARSAGQPAPRVAEVIRGQLLRAGGIREVVVTGPGFINMRLQDAASADLVREILRCGSRYGHGSRNGSGSSGGGGVVSLRAARDVRAVVQLDVVARLLRSQGCVVETSCAGALDTAWGSGLGVRVDRTGGDGPVGVRPVPVSFDPLPLGRDAGRWALLYPAPGDRPRAGDEYLVQRESNPLFRVRYAHARCRAAVRNAGDLGFGAEPGSVEAPGLVQALADYPRVLAGAADHRSPDRLARHLVTVADAVLPLLPGVLPLGEEKPSAAHRARLALAEAAGTVLAGGLSLLGIDAPDHL